MNTELVMKGNFVDLHGREIYPAEVVVSGGLISNIRRIDTAPSHYILPGFVDAHVHIESSMLVPTAFARLAVVHGTVATVSDPHEIANVCGIEGVQFMIDNSKETPFKFFFGAPSCVPATGFETAGATLNASDVARLLATNDIWYLSEMMNYPGVLNGDPDVMAKLQAAKAVGKPIDGHAPGLKGALAAQYASAGITTDHECFSLEEALDKVALGMKCLIREGSAAKNFEALAPLLQSHPHAVMFCSDDKHPDELVLYHINQHVKRALEKGYDLFDVLRAACLHPVQHYGLPVGLLRVGDPADFIVADNLDELNVLETYINGELVARNGQTLLPQVRVTPINNFLATKLPAEAFRISAEKGVRSVRVIDAIEGQLITHEVMMEALIVDGNLESNTDSDMLKIAVINRYAPNSDPAVAFVRNFGLKKGAMASTVAHDCHNIIAVGVDDASIAAAVNAVIDVKGGISVAVNPTEVYTMPLPVAGLMTDKDGYEVAREYSLLDRKVKDALATSLHAPFMTLSFMALLVIPSLKLSDKGLFDGTNFTFTDLQVTA